ncbi:MAG: small multi-drug export protein [Clostridia bacterium]|nr:small multi-drug export protein [Clostridia bacterium]
MADFFADCFSDCIFLGVFILAMIPMVEAKVAIPFALSVQLWGDAVLSPVAAYFLALVGGMLPAIFVILLARMFKRKTSGFVVDKFSNAIEEKYGSKLGKIKNKSSTFKKCLALAAFVAVPLPLTGVYSGSLIGGFTNLNLWQSFLSVLVGDMVACGGVLLSCLLFENSAFYVMIASLVLIVVFALVNMAVMIVNKIRKKGKLEI